MNRDPLPSRTAEIPPRKRFGVAGLVLLGWLAVIGYLTIPALRSEYFYHSAESNGVELTCNGRGPRFLGMCDVQHAACDSRTNQAGWEALIAMVTRRQLNQITLKGRWVTDDKIQELCNAGGVQWLFLDGTSITEAGTEHFRKCDVLQVGFGNDHVSDGIIKSIVNTPHVGSILLSYSKNDPMAIQELVAR